MAKKYVTLDEMLAKLPLERQAKIQEMTDELILEAGLFKIREDLNLSQKIIADNLGISQPAVAQIEQRGNEIRISTLKRYVEAMGGKLSLTVQMPTGDSKIFTV